MTRTLAFSLALLSVSAAAMAAVLAASGTDSRCKSVHAEMVEHRSTTACRPGHAACFLGTVDGNHGLRGTTYFRGDSAGTPAPTAPTFTPYGGLFEYATAQGTLTAREAGIVSNSEGVVTAFQRVIAGTGEFEGATGGLYVAGTLADGRVTTTVFGQLCKP